MQNKAESRDLVVLPPGHALLQLAKQNQSEKLPENGLKDMGKFLKTVLALVGITVTMLTSSSVSLLTGAI